jgi:hypothetical protein
MPRATAPESGDGTLERRERWTSLAEVLLGTFIVIGHNVLHLLPNEVPILFGLFWISLAYRGGGWNRTGLSRPASWIRTA